MTRFSGSVLGGDDGGESAQNPLRDIDEALGVLLHAMDHPEQPRTGELLQPGHAHPQQLSYRLPPLATPHSFAASLLVNVNTDLLR